jgi:hypothetical protein
MLSNDLLTGLPYIAIICGVAFVFSYIELILIRHAIKYIIWLIWGSFVVLMVGAAIAMFLVTKDPMGGGACLFAALVFIVILFCYRRRIRLVVKLFKEASLALIDVPALMFEPILVSNYRFIFS